MIIDGTTTGETPEERRIRLGRLPDTDLTPEPKEASVTYKYDRGEGKVVTKAGRKSAIGG